MTTNRDLYSKDPVEFNLLNNGVAHVSDARDDQQLKTLRYEMQTFVCEGEYEKGLAKILRTYLGNLSKPEQPAVWVSGFYGSGKSHLVKLLRYLWTDFRFPDDGAAARDLTHLPVEIKDLLKELSTHGKRYGGLFAAGGTLGASGGDSVRLALLQIVFAAADLPKNYPAARFILWLKKEGLLEKFRGLIESTGRNFEKELLNMYVSPVVAKALLEVNPGIAKSQAEVGPLLSTQFPIVKDISSDEMVVVLEEALTVNGKFPLALIVLDEAQQYIGDDQRRSHDVQQVTEACCKRFGGRLLFVATGQMALTGTAQLQKIKDRFTIPVQLSDTDVDQVIRQLVLLKKPDKVPEIKAVVEKHSGEISRHLVKTKIGPVPEDVPCLVQDYPLLPVRRRFWEKALRAVDVAGTTSQLRSQLKIVHEAVRENATKELGVVVPGDVVYDQKRVDLLQTGVLLREIDDVIERQKDGTEDGVLRARLCALIFLIGRLPTEQVADIGLRATPDTLADLLVEDLRVGSSDLRKRIPPLLQQLVEDGRLMQIGEEYRLQTQQSSAWEAEYRKRLAKILNDVQRIAGERKDLIRGAAGVKLKGVTCAHGKSKVPRSINQHYGNNRPDPAQPGMPVWIRDGWSEDEKTVVTDAREAGNDSPIILVHIPQRSSENLRREIAIYFAAKETLDFFGVPSLDEGKEARRAMETRRDNAQAALVAILDDILGGARVYQGGGNELTGNTLANRVEQGVTASLLRLYPQFDEGDDGRWKTVFDQARNGAGNALEMVGHTGDVDRHPVCSAILKELGPGKKGSDLQKTFSESPYGWPQDAIDGAIMCLLVSGHLRAVQNGTTVSYRELNQQKIKVTFFNLVSVTLSVSQRIAIRKVFKAAGLDCKTNEEDRVAGTFIKVLIDLARSSGGEVPLPECPSPPLLKEIAASSGNEQLLLIYEHNDDLTQWIEEWRKAADLAKERGPKWQDLLHLFAHANGLPIASEVQTEIEAIRSQRSLLSQPDPIADLSSKLTGELRKSLVQLHGNYESDYTHRRMELEATEPWKKLDAGSQSQILNSQGLTAVPGIQVGTQHELLDSLNHSPLETWRTLADALPQRFEKALLEAVKRTEPKAVHVKLPPATFKAPEDLEPWIESVRKEILEKLKEGPVIV